MGSGERAGESRGEQRSAWVPGILGRVGGLRIHPTMKARKLGHLPFTPRGCGLRVPPGDSLSATQPGVRSPRRVLGGYGQDPTASAMGRADTGGCVSGLGR